MKRCIWDPRAPGWHALSLRQPWCNIVLYLGKRIENRDWPIPPSFRGEFLIHASKIMHPRKDWEPALETAEDVLGLARCYEIEAACGGGDKPTHPRELGGIVGKARLVSVIARSGSFPLGGVEAHYGKELVESGGWRWHFHDQLGLVLADVAPVPFTPCSGALGFWKCKDETVAELVEKGAIRPMPQVSEPRSLLPSIPDYQHDDFPACGRCGQTLCLGDCS